MSKETILTKYDIDTIRLALNHAIDERVSYAESYTPTYGNIPEDFKTVINRCNKEIRRMERLHLKIFGKKSRHQELVDKFSKCKTVSIWDLD